MTQQRIYDSKRQELVNFVPLVPNEVGMYVCGPTVQSAPHIGHLRSALAYDLMRRWFTATGHRVTFIRNVTDIDDKILAGAAASASRGEPEEWWALAYRVEREFTAAYEAIGVAPPTYEPRATANIDRMIELIERLIERGHAYQAADGSASVYFDARSHRPYGELTRQSLDHMEDAADSEPVGKRDPRDFALWKAHREHEPLSASWESPWGRGRPGWHIECSAMATRYLGTEFDIHGGGLDLRFPHHENELAQSSAAGDAFARYWVHNGLVNTSGQKMSKSLGNSLFAADLLDSVRPVVLRYFLGSAHYRSVLDYSPEALVEAEAAYARVEAFLERAQRHLAAAHSADSHAGTAHAGLSLASQGADVSVEHVPTDFAAAMYDDFAVPQALAVVHGSVRAGNSAIDADDSEAVAQHASDVVAMLDVLGLARDTDGGPTSSESSGHAAYDALGELVETLLDDRRQAREARDFATSDAIRDRLADAGITLVDGAQETRWSLT